MNTTSLCLAVIGLFFAGVLKGTTGIGYSSCALPFLVAAVGLKPAIALLVIPAMASNVVVARSAGYFRETVTRFWPLYAASLPGIALGIVLLGWLEPRIPTRLLGISIVLYTGIALLRPGLSIGEDVERVMQIPVGLMNGILTGLTGSQVMPLMPYMLALKLDADRMVQAVNLAVISASMFLAVGLLLTGLMSGPTLGVAVLAVGPALAGVELGNWVRRQIPSGQFRLIILVVLLGMGVSLTAHS